MASTIADLIDKLKEYIELKAEQLKLQAIPHFSRFVSGFIAISMLAVLGILLMFFLSLALANFFNDLMDSSYLGYLVIAGFYLVFILFVLVLVKTGKVQDWVEQLILKASKNEED